MVTIVGNEQDLIERVRKAFSEKEPILVRAINDNELDQLLRTGAEAFHFNRRTEYETANSTNGCIGSMVGMYSKERNGTVIVYPLKQGDIGSFWDESRRFDIYGWAYCINSFTAPVEVYNVKGFGFEELRQLRKRGTVIDQIAKEIFAEAYAKK